MKITVTPADLIERFIWDKYVYYCLDGVSSTEIKKIINDNIEFEISEKDSFVIGLTNVLYTDEVIYKFKQYLLEIINTRNFELERRLYINRQILLDSVNNFKTKIPNEFVAISPEFNLQLNKLDVIYLTFTHWVNELISVNVQDWPCVKCGQVKKLINKI